MVEKRKTEAMAAKRRRARGGISSSSKEEDNYENNTRDEIDLDQADNDKNLLQLWDKGVRGSYKQRFN